MNTPRRLAVRVSVLLVGLAATFASPSVARAQDQDIDVCIDTSEQAVALKKVAKLIDERKALSRCAASSCPEPVMTSCRARLAEVNRAIPTIVFATKDRSGRDVPFVKLSIDGVPYVGRLDGGAVALDPGDHEFRFEVPGAPPVVQHFVLHESEQDRRETVLVSASNEGDHDPRRAIALGVGGVGVAGLLAGVVLGALSLAAHDSYERDCGPAIGAPSGRCNADAIPGERDAATKGTVATALLVGGGAVTIVGAVWYLVQRASGPSKGIQVGMRPSGGAFEVEF